jgi:hypothetical protein
MLSAAGLLALALAALLAALARGQGTVCTIAMLQDVNDILPICCRGTMCGTGMPARCAPECADLLVPFWQSCSALMQFMGNDALGFDLHAVSEFIEPCEQTLALVSAGAESCDAGTGRGGAGDLHSWVDDVNSACCMQNGINVCRDGSAVPWVCNADCVSLPAKLTDSDSDVTRAPPGYLAEACAEPNRVCVNAS